MRGLMSLGGECVISSGEAELPLGASPPARSGLIHGGVFAGRRRAILILVLTSLLLITIDLRGNTLLDAARNGFDQAMRPSRTPPRSSPDRSATPGGGSPSTTTWRPRTSASEEQIDAMRHERHRRSQRSSTSYSACGASTTWSRRAISTVWSPR